MDSTDTLDVLVTGELVVDHHIYQGERLRYASDARGVCTKREIGGAELDRRLLVLLADDVRQQEKKNEATDKPLAPGKIPAAQWRVQLGVETPAINEEPVGSHVFALWRPCAAEKGKKDLVWRIDRFLGFGQSSADERRQPNPAAVAAKPRVLVLDEAGYRFRSRAHAALWWLPKESATNPDWIVLKMASPVARGDLWFELTERFADRLVCVISADDMRQECVSLSQGLSWERTIDEMRAIITQNPALERLGACRHLVVRFRTDGALWIDRGNPQRPRAMLVYDAASAEGIWETQFEGGATGYSSVLTAALAHAAVCNVASGTDRDLDLAPAIEAGLSGARNLLSLGHGAAGSTAPDGFPAERLAKAILAPTSVFARISAPFPRAGERLPAMAKGWSIVEMSQHSESSDVHPSLIGLARQIVLKGDSALRRLPHARFGAMTTLDRIEIETLRGIRRLMLDYRAQSRPKKPLSIGVFGPPGAGKSFGVKQLANEVFGKEAWLEFNLSQFDGPDDLMGAFHQVRDIVLSGITPVVFWDEFDSQEYKWLQFLLAPMQDGRFQEGQLNHAVGKGVFVFAGGTSATFAAFGPGPHDDRETQNRFRLRKGPDFHSRLDAFYNVLGPNRRETADASGTLVPDTADICHPLRRALLIRALLGCKPDDRLDFDSDLLDALLLVPRYMHGARSLEKLVLQLKAADGGPIRRSNLPAADQFGMHIDAEAFMAILARNEMFRMENTVEPLAKVIHEYWREMSRNNGWSKKPEFDMPFEALAEMHKEDNRAAARRIPEVLALAGMGIAEGKPVDSDPGEAEVRDHIAHHLERLAEAEHDGWMEHRLKNGWRYGSERSDPARVHDRLVPYDKLPDFERQKDRSSVNHYPELVAKAGYRIVWL